MKNARLNTLELQTIIAGTADGLTPNAIAANLGRDRSTVVAALQRPGVSEQVEVVRAELADKYEELNHRMLDSITEVDISKINAYQRVISSGVLTDKMRLLRGQSTVNSMSVLLTRHVRDLEPNLASVKSVDPGGDF